MEETTTMSLTTNEQALEVVKQMQDLYDKNNVEEQPDTIVVDQFNWIVPQCCREGWASCPHVPKKQRKVKNNVGL